MKGWVLSLLAIIVLTVLLSGAAWSSYNGAVKELCQALGWQGGGSSFSGPAYCTEESPDGNQTNQCVWTDAAGGECSPRWPVVND